MGFFGDIWSGVKSIGSTIAREAADLGGGLVGGIHQGIGGDPVSLPKVRGLSDVPEWLGAQVGEALGVTAKSFFDTSEPIIMARVEKQARKDATRASPTAQASPVGTAGVEAAPARTWLETLRDPWGVPDPEVRPENMTTALALPGGAAISTLGKLAGGRLGALATGIGLGEAAEAVLGFFEGGDDVAQLPALPGAQPGAIFRVQNARLVPRRTVTIMNPSTGNLVHYKNMGRPILYSGDLAACKRVAKVASRARRSAGRKR